MERLLEVLFVECEEQQGNVLGFFWKGKAPMALLDGCSVADSTQGFTLHFKKPHEKSPKLHPKATAERERRAELAQEQHGSFGKCHLDSPLLTRLSAFLVAASAGCLVN